MVEGGGEINLNENLKFLLCWSVKGFLAYIL
jgi:hypothetical protein